MGLVAGLFLAYWAPPAIWLAGLGLLGIGLIGHNLVRLRSVSGSST